MKITKAERIGTIEAMRIIDKVDAIFGDELSQTLTRKVMSKKLNALIDGALESDLSDAYIALVKKYGIVTHTHFALLTELMSINGVDTTAGLEIASETVMNYKKNNDVFEIERDDYTDDVDDGIADEDIKYRKVVFINKDKIPTLCQRIKKRLEYAPKKFKANNIARCAKIKFALGMQM